MQTARVTQAARSSRESGAVRILARAGFAVSGVVNAIIGFIAIGIALSGGGSADQSGAFGAIADSPGGVILLWVFVIALAALGLWYGVGAFLSRERETKRRASAIAKGLGKGIAYLALAATALSFVVGSGNDSAEQSSSITAALLSTPGGVILVVVIGLLFCGVGVYSVHKGVTRGFEEDITVPTGSAGKAVRAVGTIGYVARGVALFIVGMLFGVAAVTADASNATGLDGALKALADLPFGKAILVIVGLGFIAAGVYSVLRAKLAKLD